MKTKHWVRAARIATSHDFDTAYGAIRFIAKECKSIVNDPTIIRWCVANNERLMAALMLDRKRYS